MMAEIEEIVTLYIQKITEKEKEIESLRTENSELEDKYAELKRDWEYLGIENERLIELAARWKKEWSDVDIKCKQAWDANVDLDQQLQSEREKVTKLRAALEYVSKIHMPEKAIAGDEFAAYALEHNCNHARSVLAEIGENK